MNQTIDLGRADGWFPITGRGDAASFAKGRVPEGINCPRQLLHRTVIIDGKTYQVRGVEHYAVPCDRCDGAFALFIGQR